MKTPAHQRQLLPKLDGALVLKRSRVRTADDHPVVLLYDPRETGGLLSRGDLVDFRGVYTWSTAGGLVRALAADSTAFGVEWTAGVGEE